MFRKTLHFGNKKVIIHLTKQPCLIQENSLFFGYPLYNSEFNIKLNNFEIGNQLKGHWLKIDSFDNKLHIVSDILGGFRIYYFIKNDEIVLSDDYEFILKHFNINPTLNNEEHEYWKRHGYTTGRATFFEGLQKVSPASIITINEYGLKEESYFKDIERTSNAIKHQKFVHQDLLETFNTIKTNNKKVILLFSGGKDSCLLLQYLLHLDIPFTLVFFKLNPISKYGALDLQKVRAVSKMLNLDLKEIEINLEKISKDQKLEIAKKQLFDKHFSLLHYEGNKKIKNLFGDNCLIINGQSSDSIFSFGPSEESLMSYFRRNMMYFPSSLISRLGLFLLTLKTNKKFRFPNNSLESLIALFDDFKYTRVILKENREDYYNYISEYIKRKTDFLNSFNSKEMFSKILSFSQGSDNQIVVNSSKFHDIEVIMPFTSPIIIYNTIQYKDERLEVKQPKYLIEKILKDEFNFNFKEIKNSIKKEPILNYDKDSFYERDFFSMIDRLKEDKLNTDFLR